MIVPDTPAKSRDGMKFLALKVCVTHGYQLIKPVAQMKKMKRVVEWNLWH